MQRLVHRTLQQEVLYSRFGWLLQWKEELLMVALMVHIEWNSRMAITDITKRSTSCSASWVRRKLHILSPGILHLKPTIARS
ncbi:hypothetical protein OPV22_012241 [Ensete ventricosum]|uniref:Uncharacterized protein n=1 Tax=Ensete ventricosum TaxID=4639 RepID=A0AAV8R2P9_ENSVE|nr:hypothetical protein OPV22_012241 [Ensete ventricosum]